MAVYTPVSEHELCAFLSQYAVGELTHYEGITEGVENTNYKVETTQARFILTLYEKRVAEAELPFFLALMEHLSGQGISCPLPVRSRAGDNIGRLAGRPAALVTFLPGRGINAPEPAHCFAAGAAMARLHEAGQSFTRVRANDLGIKAWPALFARFADHADTIAPGLRTEIERELSAIGPRWPTNLPSGTVHADMFPDNVFFDDEAVSGIIDFYFACQDWLAYDLAIGINAWAFDAGDCLDLARAKALVDGYASVRLLEDAERRAIPILCRGAALRFLLTRAYDWLNTDVAALVRPHDPLPYLRRIEEHRRRPHPTDYGL